MTTGSTGAGASIAIHPPVRVESGLCSRFRSTKSKCTACAAVCPASGAVRFGEHGAEITAACVSCGACASACPNGALRPEESDQHIVQRIRRKVRPETVFRIGCARSEGRAELVLSCLGRLTEALTLEAIRGGAQRVELLHPDCAGCELKRAEPQWLRTLTFARSLCECAGLEPDQATHRIVPLGKAQETPEHSEVNRGRRALFRAFSDRWKAIESTDSADATEPVVFRELVKKRQQNPKRVHLLDALSALPGVVAEPSPVAAAAVPMGMLKVDSRCVGCDVCETLCPVAALSHSDTAGIYALKFDPALCTGCGICEAACFHKAIRVQETVDLSLLFDRRKVTLIKAPRRTCKSCGEAFLDESSPEFCPSCRLSGSRRDAIAKRFFSHGEKL